MNILGTVKLLEAAVKNKVKRVIYPSSTVVYGNCEDLPLKETTPLQPSSPYGLEKVTSENYMKLFSKLYDIDTVSLRYFNVYGPGQSDAAPHVGGVTCVIRQIRETGKSQLFGDGRQTRDMIFIDDVINANILAMEREEKFYGAAYNICTGKSVVIAEMHERISELMGVKSTREYLPFPKGTVIHSVGDNALARIELGFEPKISLEEGVKMTIEWWDREHQKH